MNRFQLRQLTAFRIFLATFIFAALLTYLLNFYVSAVPIDSSELGTGGLSIAMLIAGAITFLVTAVVGLVSNHHLQVTSNRLSTRVASYLSLLFLTLIITTISLFFLFIVIILLNLSFIDSTLFRFGASLLNGSVIGVANYSLFNYAMHIDIKKIARILLYIFIIGLSLSMITTADASWWENSLSYLGFEARSAFFFEATLVLSGILALMVAFYLSFYFYDLYKQDSISRIQYTYIVGATYLIGIQLMMIGIFPVRVTPFTDLMHNLGANTMVLNLIGVAIMLPIVVKKYTASFKYASISIGVVTAISVFAHYVLEVYSFVALELIIFALFGSWLSLAVDNTVELNSR